VSQNWASSKNLGLELEVAVAVGAVAAGAAAVGAAAVEAVVAAGTLAELHVLDHFAPEATARLGQPARAVTQRAFLLSDSLEKAAIAAAIEAVAVTAVAAIEAVQAVAIEAVRAVAPVAIFGLARIVVGVASAAGRSSRFVAEAERLHKPAYSQGLALPHFLIAPHLDPFLEAGRARKQKRCSLLPANPAVTGPCAGSRLMRAKRLCG